MRRTICLITYIVFSMHMMNMAQEALLLSHTNTLKSTTGHLWATKRLRSRSEQISSLFIADVAVYRIKRNVTRDVYQRLHIGKWPILFDFDQSAHKAQIVIYQTCHIPNRNLFWPFEHQMHNRKEHIVPIFSSVVSVVRVAEVPTIVVEDSTVAVDFVFVFVQQRFDMRFIFRP